MSDNSFEKKVRQELQGFGVHPSDKVWAGLEAGLKERKRRRGGFIWFFLGTLLLGGGVWLAVKQSTLPAANTVAENTSKNLFKTIPNPEPAPEGGISSGSNQDGQPEIIEKVPSAASAPAGIPNTSTRNVPYSPIKRIPAEESIPRPISTSQPAVNTPEDREKQMQISEKPSQETDQISVKNPITEVITNEDPKAEQPLPARSGSEASGDTSPEQSGDKKDSAPRTETGTVAPLKKNKLEKVKKWDISLTGSGGLSEVTSGFLREGTKSNDLFNSAGNFGPTMPISYTHSQERSYGLSAGVEARRWLNKSLALSAGLQYQFQRTNSMVGLMSGSNLVVNNGSRDLSVDRFYLPGALTQYRNRYHLIDLPVQIQMAWGHKKLPFIAGIGLQPGILVGSNALIKDRSGILFTDKENFNRFQFGFNGGISVRLMKNSKMPLEVGPQLQYRLTNVFKDETGYRGHLFYFGLQAKWRLLSF